MDVGYQASFFVRTSTCVENFLVRLDNHCCSFPCFFSDKKKTPRLRYRAFGEDLMVESRLIMWCLLALFASFSNFVFGLASTRFVPQFQPLTPTFFQTRRISTQGLLLFRLIGSWNIKKTIKLIHATIFLNKLFPREVQEI